MMPSRSPAPLFTDRGQLLAAMGNASGLPHLSRMALQIRDDPSMTQSQAIQTARRNGPPTGSTADLPNVGKYVRDIKNAGSWALPYAAAATASAPAYALGAAKYGAPEIQKGYRENGFFGALGGINEAARKVPGIGNASVDLMEMAEQYADIQGASGLGRFIVDMSSPDPMGKIGALASAAGPAAKALGGLNLAVIPAFVGSPHRWGVNPKTGRLGTDMSKIGTGEGAQAFGFGHYSAQNREVAESYKTAGWTFEKELELGDGRKVQVLQRSNLKANHETVAAEALNRFDGDRDVAIEWLDDPEAGPTDQAAAAFLRDNPDAKLIDKPGSVYGVTHDVNPEDLLDLDVPLGQQSEKVQRSLKSMPEFGSSGNHLDSELDQMTTEEIESMLTQMDRHGEFGQEWDGEMLSPEEWRENLISSAKEMDVDGDVTSYLFGEMGSDTQTFHAAYEQLVARTGSPEAASRALRDAGIPGSMFYDGVSRKGGEGTRNYVMFDDDMTYVDPSRTDPELIGGLHTGAPHRTIDDRGAVVSGGLFHSSVGELSGEPNTSGAGFFLGSSPESAQRGALAGGFLPESGVSLGTPNTVTEFGLASNAKVYGKYPGIPSMDFPDQIRQPEYENLLREIDSREWSPDAKVNKKAKELAQRILRMSYGNTSDPLVMSRNKTLMSDTAVPKELDLANEPIFAPDWDGWEWENIYPDALRALGFDAGFVRDEAGLSTVAITDRALKKIK